MKRSIYIPLEPQSDEIGLIRSKHDNLFGKIDPHITLVFPFESDASNTDLVSLIERATVEFPPFDYTLSSHPSDHGDVVAFQVASNKSSFLRLHDDLYQGILSNYLSSDHPYQPHVTVARVSDNTASIVNSIRPIKSVNFTAKQIILESISPDDSSTTEYICTL